MDIGFYVLISALIIIIALTVKILLMQKSLKDIESDFEEILKTDTNTVIGVSSPDKYIRSLAKSLNKQLNTLRKEHNRYTQGDTELKNAVTNISHDLRTPLTAICGYLELLEKEEKSENAKRYIKQIEERTEVMNELTQELFRYSVITSVSELKCEKTDIRSVLESNLLSFYASFEQNRITPEISLPEKPVFAFLDKSALSRIFSNIISNAVKYSDGDFSVTLHENGKIIFSNSCKNLSSVDAAKLFNRFYTVDSAIKSTGLGLSIAKFLTERMNGKISSEYKNNMLYITVQFNTV